MHRKLTILVFLATATLFAQSNQGTITGAISDPAGAVIPGAVIQVKNQDTGVVFNGGTSATGNYVIPVPVGTYEITVTAAGFKKFVQQGVPVVSATDTRKDINLEVGAATETVTVEDTAPLLKTESGEMSHQVTITDADQLPVLTISGGSVVGTTNGMGQIRNPMQVSELLPGVNFSNDNSLVVNGMPSNSESIHIDGQDATGNIWKVLQQNQQGASVDAIQEVTVQTSNFSAEYGAVGGGYFNYTMKSGTNQLHGSAYDYFVNEALNAGLPFTDAGTQNPAKEGQQIRNAVRRNDYGFTVGGPIEIPKVYKGRDKTFFFFNFEQFRQNSTISNGIWTVPTTAYRAGNFATAGCFALIGSFCATPPIVNTATGQPAVDPAGQALTYGEIFDPNSTHVVNGAQVRNPFPNQRIPSTRFDPVMSAIQNMFPLPNGPGITNNYTVPAYLAWQHTTNWSFKLDHSISPTVKLSWYFDKQNFNANNANGVTEAYNSPNPTANRSITTRVNYDETIRPTLLLHVGVGYLTSYQPTDYQNFNQSSIGLSGYFQNNRFPSIGGFFDGGQGLNNFFTGGYGGPNGGGLGPAFISFLWEEKPTANVNLTWVKGNHSFKYGGEMIIDGYPEHSGWRANGAFGLSNAETSDPWQNLQPLNFANPTGFNYASFLLGLVDDIQISPNTQTKTGNHTLGFYAQDSWKVTRKLTLDYGLRYDYQTYLQESHGRMPIASFTTINPTVGLPGAEIYGATCNCQLSHNYPYALGPRVGLAYQINSKTVLRAGAGVTYGDVQTPQGIQYSLANYYSFNSTGYGISPAPNGFPAANPYPNVTWPNYNPGRLPVPTAGQLPPSSPNTIFNPSARPPRQVQWSVGFQREVQKDLVAEVMYVGNRGVWWSAEGLDQYQCNCLTDQMLAKYGISRSNPASLALLSDPIGSPQAVAAGFKVPYTGFPLSDPVNQAIRPIPQWASGGPTSFLGPPMGKTWYDSLQTKLTKRFSHGLSAQASFVWSKATDIGAGSEAPIFLSYNPVIEDIFNYANAKQLNQLNPPLELIISGTYQTPKLPSADSGGMKVLSQVVRDWQLGWLLRYQNGALIEVPSSTNLLEDLLLRGGGFNGTPINPANLVAGVNPLAVDPNSKSFNPQTTTVFNPAAFSDPAPGQWGTSAPFYNNLRWQRQPAESMSFGRNFRFGKEGRYNFFIRAEFQNIFNRLLLNGPSTGNQQAGFFGPTTLAASPVVSNGVLTGGLGYVPTVGGQTAVPPRSGQIVARFTF